MSDIKQKTKIGMVWNVVEKIAAQVISFVLNIILARLLTPHDYGTIGMLSIFLTFSNVFIDSGFSRALIQKQDRNESDYSTTLIFNIIISCFLYAILFFCSPAIADFYKTPELVGLQRVFFIVIILNSLTVVQNSRLQASVNFKFIAIINTVTQILGGIIGIIAAYKGLGPWALVIQALSRAFISAVLFWVLGRWVPKTGFSIASFKKLFGFGSKLLLSGLLGTTVTNVYNLVIGKVFLPESLGYYTRAQQFPELTSGTLASVLNNATFPLLASLQNDTENLVKTLKRLIKLTSLVVFPAMIGLAVLSKPIILALLGEKWMPAAEFLFWISLSYVFKPLSMMNMSVLNAIGRSDLFLKVDVAKIPFIAATMIITFNISLRAVVIGSFISAFLYFYINSFMTGKLYNYGCFKQLYDSRKPILASIVMGLVVYFSTKFMNNSMIEVLAGIPIGVVSYSLVLFVLKEEEFFTLLEKGKNYLKKR